MSLDAFKKKYQGFINPDFPEYFFPFSLLSLNRLAHEKGIKSGCFIQFIGDEKTGKTTLATDLCRSCQEQGYQAGYVDFEHTFDLEYATFLGVNTEELILVQPDTAERGLNAIRDMVEAGVKLVVLDSIAVLTSEEDFEKDLTEHERKGASSSLITRFIRRMIPILHTHGALLIIINQYRANMSPMSKKSNKAFGPAIIQYMSSLTLELTRIKNGEDESIVKAFVEKTKLGGKERKSAEIVMIYQQGFDVDGDIIRIALEEGIVEKKGSWFQYGEQRAQGMNQAREVFPIEEIKARILSTNTGATERL